jgi:hypothetical protein
MKIQLVIVKKPMFKKQYQIERHYIDNDNNVYKKDVFVGKEYKTFPEACQALRQMELA